MRKKLFTHQFTIVAKVEQRELLDFLKANFHKRYSRVIHLASCDQLHHHHMYQIETRSYRMIDEVKVKLLYGLPIMWITTVTFDFSGIKEAGFAAGFAAGKEVALSTPQDWVEVLP